MPNTTAKKMIGSTSPLAKESIGFVGTILSRICEIGSEAARLEDEGIAAMTRNGLQVPPYAEADAEAWNRLFSSTMEGLMADWYSREFTSAVYEAIGR